MLPRKQGPTVIPYRNMAGEERGVPNNPADYGRYCVIDLDANNAAAVNRMLRENPEAKRPNLGFGVCRHGFGLQNLGWLDEETATTYAKRLNASIPIGANESALESSARFNAVVAELSA